MSRGIILGCACGLFVYTVARAACLSFTTDEGSTYVLFVHPPGLFASNLNALGGWATNDHLLNTWAMKAVRTVLGDGELALRLPNLLAHLVFLAVSALLLARAVPDRRLQVAAWILLNCNPYLLEFFSLARGYGLCLALLMLHLYLAWHFIYRQGSPWLAVASLATAALTVLANMASLNYFLPGAVYLIALSLRRAEPGKITAALCLMTLLLSAAVIPHLLRLRTLGGLIFGGNTGFWFDTVGSLISDTLYNTWYAPYVVDAVATLVFLTVAAAVLVGVRHVAGMGRDAETPFLVFVCTLLCAAAVCQVLSHACLGTRFVRDRVATYLIPLFMMAFILLLSYLSRRTKLAIGIAAVASALSLLHLASCLNLTGTSDWPESVDVKRCVVYLQSHHTAEQAPIVLETGRTLVPVVQYYSTARHLDWLKTVNKDEAPATMLFTVIGAGDVLAQWRPDGYALQRPRSAR